MKNIVAYVANVPIPTTYSSSIEYRMSFHIALFERGGSLWYATSFAAGAAAFTARRAAWTIGRSAGGVRLRWSETAITRSFSIIAYEQAAHDFPARSRMTSELR